MTEDVEAFDHVSNVKITASQDDTLSVRMKKYDGGMNLEKAKYDFGLKLYDTANLILGGTVVFQFASEKKSFALYVFGLVFFFALYYAAYNVCRRHD